MNDALIQSLLKFAIRRGLTVLGTAGAAVSEEWIATTAALLLVGLNELVQWWKAHQAEKAKANTVKLAS